MEVEWAEDGAEEEVAAESKSSGSSGIRVGSMASLSSGVLPEVIARCLRERPFRPVSGGSFWKFLADSSVSAFLPGSGSVGPRSSGNRVLTLGRTPVCVPKLEEPVQLFGISCG